MCDWIKSSLPVEVYGENGHKLLWVYSQSLNWNDAELNVKSVLHVLVILKFRKDDTPWNAQWLMTGNSFIFHTVYGWYNTALSYCNYFLSLIVQKVFGKVFFFFLNKRVHEVKWIRQMLYFKILSFFLFLFEKRLYNLMYSICKNYFNCWLAEYTTCDYVCYIFHEMWAIKREHCLSVPACTGSCSDCHLVGDLRRGSILFMLLQSTDWATWGKKTTHSFTWPSLYFTVTEPTSR